MFTTTQNYYMYTDKPHKGSAGISLECKSVFLLLGGELTEGIVAFPKSSQSFKILCLCVIAFLLYSLPCLFEAASAILKSISMMQPYTSIELQSKTVKRDLL